LDMPLIDGGEPFRYNDTALPCTIDEFWAWNGSNLLSNTLRGVLAEFIVAKALGIRLTQARDEWTEYDLLYPYNGRGVPVEVKSSAYLQTWEQSKPSAIRFGIAPARAWENQQYADTPKRHAEIYVFCLFAYQDMETKAIAKPMQLEQWEFYVLETSKLDALGTQHSLSLRRLKTLQPVSCTYATLKETVDTILRKYA